MTALVGAKNLASQTARQALPILIIGACLSVPGEPGLTEAAPEATSALPTTTAVPTTITTAGLATTSTGLAPVAATELRLFQPFGGASPPPGWPIEEAVGECFGPSGAVIRPDAWRCMTEERLFDPCFEDPYGKDQVACPQMAEKRQLVVLRLEAPLPFERAHGVEEPGETLWALELADGQLCVFLTGGTAVVAGLRLNYACPRGFVFGDPNRSGELWRVFFQEEGSDSLVEVEVRVAWG